MTNKNIKKAVKVLRYSNKEILNRLKAIIKTNKFSYRTFGTDIEEHLSDILIDIFRRNGFIVDNSDYKLAPHKNYFPDFELKSSPPFAVEFKSGNKSQLRGGKWIPVKNSENDMGTISEWPKKIKKFGGDNIFYIFVIYNFNDKTKEILKIETAPFYRFLGLNKDGLLKYREKDGNLRPKDFDISSPITTFSQFNELLKKTIAYRSKRIIKKHRAILKSLKNESK